MIGTLLKGVAYTRAPKLTFRVLHPKEAAQLKMLPYELRYGFAPRLTAVVAAAVALPLGILIGRRLERRAVNRRRSRRVPAIAYGSRPTTIQVVRPTPVSTAPTARVERRP